jgi:hypothetical protein
VFIEGRRHDGRRLMKDDGALECNEALVFRGIPHQKLCDAGRLFWRVGQNDVVFHELSCDADALVAPAR